MKWIFPLFIILSFLSAAVSSRMNELSASILKQGTTAVTLTVTLIGSMAIWSGLMNIAQHSGITDKINKLICKITGFIFTGLNKSSEAMKAISMNITANILGLGNAATPLGIKAMKKLYEEDKICHSSKTAGDNMILFVVMNTASMQLIPTTVIALRSQHQSQNPGAIILCVIVSSLISLSAGIVCAKIFSAFSEKGGKNND